MIEIVPKNFFCKSEDGLVEFLSCSPLCHGYPASRTLLLIVGLLIFTSRTCCVFWVITLGYGLFKSKIGTNLVWYGMSSLVHYYYHGFLVGLCCYIHSINLGKVRYSSHVVHPGHFYVVLLY